MKLLETNGRRYLFVMAVDAEYGPELSRRFSPLFTGVGPVEAAATASSALSVLAATDRMPDIVVSLGSAGSSTLTQTDVYQVSTVSYRDMDASGLGFATFGSVKDFNAKTSAIGDGRKRTSRALH